MSSLFGFWDNRRVKRLTLFSGWLVVVLLATVLTWQIVSAADDQVSERPIAPLNVAAPVIASTGSTTTAPTPPSTTSTTTGSPSSTTVGSTSATGTAGSATTSSTTTSPPTTVAWQTRTVQTAGGTVNLRYRPGEVTYQSATPAPGYHVEAEKQGPPDVKVEFESASEKIELEASWQDDGLDVQVSQEDGD